MSGRGQVLSVWSGRHGPQLHRFGSCLIVELVHVFQKTKIKGLFNLLLHHGLLYGIYSQHGCLGKLDRWNTWKTLETYDHVFTNPYLHAVE